MRSKKSTDWNPFPYDGLHHFSQFDLTAADIYDDEIHLSTTNANFWTDNAEICMHDYYS